MPCIEIGGNFCLSQQEIDAFGHDFVPYASGFRVWNNVVFTHSGRSAITTAVRHLGLEGCKVLVPAFSCHSITDAFLACDCKVTYYPINRDLTADETELFRLMEDHMPAILYICPLFGFDTSFSLRKRYKEIQDKGIRIIEDVTHSMLSGFAYTKADVVVCSLRKWLEVPDGGFMYGLNGFDTKSYYSTHQEQTEIVSNFISASKYKLDYLKSGQGELKEVFLPLFYKNNDLFDDTGLQCRMSSFSYEILSQADFKHIIERRRVNYDYLLSHIKNPLVDIIFKSLPADVVPLYMPVYVENGRRADLQCALINERLYCPVIWPTPSQVLAAYPAESLRYHNDILSLVIDQRYDVSDMERLAWNINHFW